MRSIFLALATIALMFLSVRADSEINFMFQGRHSSGLTTIHIVIYISHSKA